MFIPIRTSAVPRQTPYANYALIAVNVVIFLLSYNFSAEDVRPWAERFVLNPRYPYLWQFVTYAFLHGGAWHIIGNMYFLYMFGNNVNDKLGNVGYLCFYLAGAVFSGIGHTLLSSNPVLGASGAVAAVTGAYLVLYPKTTITIMYMFFFIGSMDLPAMLFIGLKLIVIDNMIAKTTANVAYDAHLSGYAFGIASIALMLTTGLLERSHFDLPGILKQFYRRKKYQSTTSSGYDPFTGQSPRKKIFVKEVKSPAQRALDEQILDLRTRTMAYISQKNLADAANLYIELLEVAPESTLPPKAHLEIANQLMAMGKWNQSADAYEKLLKQDPSHEHIEQIQLMLGILYSRYLENKDLADKYLTAAMDKLKDPGQIQMCKNELKKLNQ